MVLDGRPRDGRIEPTTRLPSGYMSGSPWLLRSAALILGGGALARGTDRDEGYVPVQNPGVGDMGITTIRRRDVMRRLLAQARTSGDPVAPWQPAGQAQGQAEGEFEDESDLLVELHHEWVRLLVARLHRGGVVAERTPAHVRDLYDELSVAHPTLRGILDAHRTNPALRDVTAREHAMLARVAGLAPAGALGDRAAAVGRALLTQRLPMQRPAPGSVAADYPPSTLECLDAPDPGKSRTIRRS